MTEDARFGWRDAYLPAGLLLLGTVELALLGTTGWVASVGLEVASAIALVFRRTHPLVAAPLSAIFMMLIPLTGTRMEEAATPILFYILGIYSLGRYLAGHSGLVALALTLLLIFADFYFVASGDHAATDVVFVLSLAVPPYVFGRISRKLALQSELLAQQQALIRDQAVREERDRIARELHDVIAHSVSAMVVQTAAAQDLVRTDPDRAERVLGTVADTGRRALDETGRLLHVLRDSDDELGLAPTPGLGDLDTLVERFREAGLLVDVVVEGEVAGLPAALDTSSYRVVQEALTNALRYAADGAVELHVLAAQDGVSIRSSNVVRAQAQGQGSGLGLAGLAERVALLGGRLTHGSTPAGRFELAAELPMRPVG